MSTRCQVGDVINVTEEMVKSLPLWFRGWEPALYVVTSADEYTDCGLKGWWVKARKLRKNGKYNPKGKWIRFSQSGPSPNWVEDVPVVDKINLPEGWDNHI